MKKVQTAKYQIVDKADFYNLQISNGESIKHLKGYKVDAEDQASLVLFDQLKNDRRVELEIGDFVQITYQQTGEYVLNENPNQTSPFHQLKSVEKLGREVLYPQKVFNFNNTVGNRLNRKINFDGQLVVVRVDFNVPLDENGLVTDTTRILAAKPTIDFVMENRGRCVLISHLGRPKGVESKLSLKHIVSQVSQVLDRPVRFCDDCVGEKAENGVNHLSMGDILLMENLRFYKEETEGDADFAKKLSNLGSVYINDAFGAAHRAHASTTIIAQYFPNKKYFGKLLESEILAIDRVLKTGKKTHRRYFRWCQSVNKNSDSRKNASYCRPHHYWRGHGLYF